MHRAFTVRVWARTLILIVLLGALWLVSLRPTATQTGAIILPVSVENLSSGTGINPVELRCEDARLSAPNNIEKLSCVLKNNTDRAIRAGTLVVNVTIEQGGASETISSYDSFDTLVNPDMHSEQGPHVIRAQGEYVIDHLPTNYGEGIVKRISESIDYIEFAEGPPLGRNVAGSRIINDVRQGAAKYKDWLVREFHRNGRSPDAILTILNKSDVIPEAGLNLQNSDQITGANLFRKFLLRTYGSKGEAELVKHLK